MAAETRPELVGKRFLCVAAGEDARPERGQSGCGRGWRAGVIRAVSHRDRGHPDLAVRAGGRPGGQRSPGVRTSGRAGERTSGPAGARQVGRTGSAKEELPLPGLCALPGRTILRLAF